MGITLKGHCFPEDNAACVEYGPIAQVTGPHYRLFPAVEVLVEEMPAQRPPAGQGAPATQNAAREPAEPSWPG